MAKKKIRGLVNKTIKSFDKEFFQPNMILLIKINPKYFEYNVGENRRNFIPNGWNMNDFSEHVPFEWDSDKKEPVTFPVLIITVKGLNDDWLYVGFLERFYGIPQVCDAGIHSSDIELGYIEIIDIETKIDPSEMEE